MRIGFAGLGNMGRPMAETLAAAGHEVTGFDTAPVEAAGVTTAPSAPDAARGAEVVVTMLPDGAVLRAHVSTRWPVRLSFEDPPCAWGGYTWCRTHALGVTFPSSDSATPRGCPRRFRGR